MQKSSRYIKISAISVCIAALAAGVFAQTPPPKPSKETKPPVRNDAPPPAEPPMAPRGITEKALAVAPNVNIKIPCIAQARVTVNGWDRDEVRVFVRNGTTANFNVHEKDPKTGKPVWIVIARQIQGRSAAPFGECISGDRIDIEVPTGSSLVIAGRQTETRIDSVKKVDIKNLGGNVALRNIAGGIAASTFEGDMTVENSSGQITLETSTGNIVAYGVAPGQIGELFRAKTQKGAITLQKVEHRQIEASSVSGTLLFSGKFLPGGIYGFKTSNGTMKLLIPAASSCRINAWYGFGSIEWEIPYKIEMENVSSGGKSLNAIIGSGQANVNITTTSGTVFIGKQPQL